MKAAPSKYGVQPGIARFQRKGHTYKQVSVMLGMREPRVAGVLRGHVVPQPWEVERLAEFLGLKPATAFTGELLVESNRKGNRSKPPPMGPSEPPPRPERRDASGPRKNEQPRRQLTGVRVEHPFLDVLGQDAADRVADLAGCDSGQIKAVAAGREALCDVVALAVVLVASRRRRHGLTLFAEGTARFAMTRPDELIQQVWVRAKEITRS